MLSSFCGHCLPSCQAERQAPGLLVMILSISRRAVNDNKVFSIPRPLSLLIIRPQFFWLHGSQLDTVRVYWCVNHPCHGSVLCPCSTACSTVTLSAGPCQGVPSHSGPERANPAAQRSADGVHSQAERGETTAETHTGQAGGGDVEV